MFSVGMSLIQLKQAYWHMTGHVKQVCIPKRLPEVYIYIKRSQDLELLKQMRREGVCSGQSSSVKLFPKSQMLVIESPGEPEPCPGLLPTCELHSGCFL